MRPLERTIQMVKRDVRLDAYLGRSKRALNLAARDECRNRSTVDFDDGIAATEADVLGRAGRENLQHEHRRVRQRRGKSESDELAVGKEGVACRAGRYVTERGVERAITNGVEVRFR